MTLLGELFSLSDLGKMMQIGLVRRQFHDTEPLAILNYTEKAQYDRVWNDVTLRCRGLIYNIETLEVVARPFPKFFNYSEPGSVSFGLRDYVIATDKQDGSLGILYKLPSGTLAIATRGSFHSEQAKHATALLTLSERYSDWYDKLYAWHSAQVVDETLLFEIIYPDNRIVLNYGDADELVVLGMVNKRTGITSSPHAAKVYFGFPGRYTPTIYSGKFEDVLKLAPRNNAEGVVVWNPDTDARVKLKQEDYVRLHRIVSGLNARAVWEHMRAGYERTGKWSYRGMLANIPDEFHSFITAVGMSLVARFVILEKKISLEMQFATDCVADEHGMIDRKSFAMEIKNSPHKSFLFSKLDGKDISLDIWDKIFPAHDWNPLLENGD